MSTFTTKGRFCLSVSLAVVVGFTSIPQLGFAQSDLRNPQPQAGSATRGALPGGLPGLSDAASDPFQLPGLPGLPTQSPATNPGAVLASQTKVVNEQFAGWRQASNGQQGDQLDEALRSHWVMADETGRISGIVYGIDGADLDGLSLTLLFRGRVVTSVKPEEDGTFAFTNVRQGTYTLAGWGENAFFGFGFNILRYNEAADENVPRELKVTAVANKTTINTDWIKFFANDVRFPVYGVHETGQGEADPPRLYGVEGQSMFFPQATPGTSLSSHQVVPTPDGRLVGRIHQMASSNGRPVELRNTRVLLLQNDDVFGGVTTDSFGVFEFEDVPPGEYSCVAVGQDGVGCIGLYVGEAGSTDPDGNDAFAPVSLTLMNSESIGWLHNLAIETAYQRIVSRPLPEPEPDTLGTGSLDEPYFGPRALRPGGYRPLPREAIPKQDRFLQRLNRWVDNLFEKGL